MHLMNEAFGPYLSHVAPVVGSHEIAIGGLRSGAIGMLFGLTTYAVTGDAKKSLKTSLIASIAGTIFVAYGSTQNSAFVAGFTAGALNIIGIGNLVAGVATLGIATLVVGTMACAAR